MNDAVAHKGFGLARLDLGQRFETFGMMARKTLLEYSRYPIAFGALFAQIFLIILLFVLTTVAFAGGDAGRISTFAGAMAYGFVVNIILSFTLWEIGFSIREEQVRGTLESLYLSPANKFSNLVSRIFAVLSITVLMCIGGLALVSAVAGGLPVNNVGKGLLALLLTTSGFLGLGFVFAGVTIKLKETAQLLVNGLQFFFMIFSAMFFPFSALRNVSPAIVTYVSGALPVSYCVDLFRQTLLGAPTPELTTSWELEWVIVVLFGILSPLIGYAIYKRIERKARMEGTLGEY
ncbi:MAG: ABC transporter permease [Methanobacteriota archaeon]|nr:MAG: ABC transporter permease [Euryarchaeota archaeon]